MIKSGDNVDLFRRNSKSWSAVREDYWDPGWVVMVENEGWSLIEKLHKSQLDFKGPVHETTLRKKVRTSSLRLSVKTPEEIDSYDYECQLPEKGACVIFRVPNTHFDWEPGIVVKKNKKSIQVMHNGSFITRGYRHFIELKDRDG